MTAHRQIPTDFDFMIGTWTVRHRRLNERLVGCQQWTEFSGTSTTRKVLGGWGNVEDNYLDLPVDPYHAVALRSYDAAAAQWSIWWLDARAPGTLDVPVVGRFEGAAGLFLAEDVIAGKPVKVRFTWLAHAAHPRWEQAFSADDGNTWETNWTMDFTRDTQG
jgi:hypothetical protein